MESRLHFEISAQPNNTTCGPTCLHAVLAYHGAQQTLAEVIEGVPSLEHGGTLAVLLGNYALSQGYEAILYTYNLIVFDPSWFRPGAPLLADRLRAQMQAKTKPKLRMASPAYFIGAPSPPAVAHLPSSAQFFQPAPRRTASP